MRIYFRNREQLAIAVLLFLAWFAIVGRYAVLNWNQRAIDIDGAPVQSYQFDIDLNSAEWTEIALIPGIGKALALRIIAFRDEQGCLESIDDLLKVNGIGPGKLESMRPFIRLANQPELRVKMHGI